MGAKSTRSVTLRLPADLHEQIRLQAAREERSISQLIRFACRRYLAEGQRPQPAVRAGVMDCTDDGGADAEYAFPPRTLIVDQTIPAIAGRTSVGLLVAIQEVTPDTVVIYRGGLPPDVVPMATTPGDGGATLRVHNFRERATAPQACRLVFEVHQPIQPPPDAGGEG